MRQHATHARTQMACGSRDEDCPTHGRQRTHEHIQMGLLLIAALHPRALQQLAVLFLGHALAALFTTEPIDDLIH